VRWLPFQLNPDLPESGIPRAEYFQRKFGSKVHYCVADYEAYADNGLGYAESAALAAIPGLQLGHQIQRRWL